MMVNKNVCTLLASFKYMTFCMGIDVQCIQGAIHNDNKKIWKPSKGSQTLVGIVSTFPRQYNSHQTDNKAVL